MSNLRKKFKTIKSSKTLNKKAEIEVNKEEIIEQLNEFKNSSLKLSNTINEISKEDNLVFDSIMGDYIRTLNSTTNVPFQTLAQSINDFCEQAISSLK